jgi:hypothetical protein
MDERVKNLNRKSFYKAFLKVFQLYELWKCRPSRRVWLGLVAAATRVSDDNASSQDGLYEAQKKASFVLECRQE